MCCASLLETVTEKTQPKFAPPCVNNPYFLYALYVPIVPGQRGYRKLTQYRAMPHLDAGGRKRI
jgi:hypothetical protein